MAGMASLQRKLGWEEGSARKVNFVKNIEKTEDRSLLKDWYA